VARRLTAFVGVCAALALGGCLGDDSDDQTTSEGETYALDVERISDDLDRSGADALVALNRLADGKAGGREVGAQLDRLGRAARRAQTELKGLTPPVPAETSAGDLAGAAGDIALYGDIAATDARATERGISTAAEVGRTQARILLAYLTGYSALSRAVRSLAVESG
jgi:hypothetical protein